MAKKNIFSPNLTQRILLYTTTTTKSSTANTKKPTFMVDYLINSLGFSHQEAILTSSKVTSLKSTENPNIVINFLLNYGFNKTQLKKLIFSGPHILSSNVDKTLKPKLEAFQILGLSGSNLTDIITGCPDTFRRSLNNHLIPTLEVLKSVFGDNDSLFVIRALKSDAWMLAARARTNIPLNVALLRSYGLSIAHIKLFFHRKSRYVVLDPKWLQAILIRVEKYGIPRNSSMFIHGVIALSSISEESLVARLNVYRRYGWSDDDILMMGRKLPYTLVLSEHRLEKSLNFFVKELGFSPSEIAYRSIVVTYSLENRVMPRYLVVKALKEKKLKKDDYSFFSCLNISESKFCEKFVMPYKDKVPGLYDSYMKGVSSSL